MTTHLICAGCGKPIALSPVNVGAKEIAEAVARLAKFPWFHPECAQRRKNFKPSRSRDGDFQKFCPKDLL